MVSWNRLSTAVQPGICFLAIAWQCNFYRVSSTQRSLVFLSFAEVQNVITVKSGTMHSSTTKASNNGCPSNGLTFLLRLLLIWLYREPDANIASINVTGVKAMASKLFRENRLPHYGQFLIVLFGAAKPSGQCSSQIFKPTLISE